MLKEKKWYVQLIKVSDVCNSIINFICVILLTAQVLAILYMVFGRYVLNKVPAWTEQFAIFAMVWFAMFSIALGVRNDAHVKVEIIDSIVSHKKLIAFKLFGNLCMALFGFILIRYGTSLCILTWKTKISALPVTMGCQYLSAVAGGLFMMFNAIVYCIETLANEQQSDFGNSLKGGENK